jgi:hypothetical protein
MLESFCAAANIKAFLQRPDCPSILQKCIPFLEMGQDKDIQGTLMTDISTLSLGTVASSKKLEHGDIDWKKRKPLDSDEYEVLTSLSDTLCTEIKNWSTPTEAFFHERYTIQGIEYANFHISKQLATVFFQPMHCVDLVPGVIRHIFSIQCPNTTSRLYTEHFFLVIHRYLPTKEPLKAGRLDLDPNFGASLWSVAMAKTPDIIPTSHRVYHAIMRQWNSEMNILKPLNKVSTSLRYSHYITHFQTGYLEDITLSHSHFYQIRHIKNTYFFGLIYSGC